MALLFATLAQPVTKDSRVITDMILNIINFLSGFNIRFGSLHGGLLALIAPPSHPRREDDCGGPSHPYSGALDPSEHQ
jgi:hypothetical protein